MRKTTVSALALMLSVGAHGVSAQDLAKNSSATARVRYIVSDVPAAAGFYTSKLGFKTVLCPAANRPKQGIPGLEVVAVERIDQAISWLRSG